MADDLVKRLLDIAGDTNEENETIHEAASRIEKLEAALREIADGANWDNGGGWGAESYPDEIARKALEGKPDKSVYKEGYRAVEEAMGHPSPEFWVERKYDR
jgi:hypothetical protein